MSPGEALPEEPCICRNDFLTVFFFVDDIVFAYRKIDESPVNALIGRLKERYKMKDLGDLRWFLGIRVIRDREARRLWLCQDDYIDKICTRYYIEKKATFKGDIFPDGRPQRSSEQASNLAIHQYAGRIGSINYIAVISRPDVAKPVSLLATFLTNPSPGHLALVDRLLRYLWATRLNTEERRARSSPDRILLERSVNLKIGSSERQQTLHMPMMKRPDTLPKVILPPYSEDRFLGKPQNRRLSRHPQQRQSF